MASAVNVAVILKQKLHHFINCNTSMVFNMWIIIMSNQNAVVVILSKPWRAAKSDVDRKGATSSMTAIGHFVVV